MRVNKSLLSRGALRGAPRCSGFWHPKKYSFQFFFTKKEQTPHNDTAGDGNVSKLFSHEYIKGQVSG